LRTYWLVLWWRNSPYFVELEDILPCLYRLTTGPCSELCQHILYIIYLISNLILFYFQNGIIPSGFLTKMFHVVLISTKWFFSYSMIHNLWEWIKKSSVDSFIHFSITHTVTCLLIHHPFVFPNDKRPHFIPLWNGR
jgi:hypothetical protein